MIGRIMITDVFGELKSSWTLKSKEAQDQREPLFLLCYRTTLPLLAKKLKETSLRLPSCRTSGFADVIVRP